MDEHDIREENAVLRQRLTTTEQKMEMMVQALEKRNDQIKEWAKMYSDLQLQFYEAQESANTQASFVQERNKTIQQLSQMIDELRQQNYVQANVNLKEAQQLREEINREKMYLIDTLNQLSQAKIPAEEALRDLGERLEKKNEQINNLTNQYKDLNDKFEKLNDDIANRDAEIHQLNVENSEMDQQIRLLSVKLADARSGRVELAQIEQLNIEVERKRQLNSKLEREKARLKKIGIKLREDLNERDSLIEQLQNNLKLVMDQNVDLRSRYSDAQNKNYNLQQKASKAFENERIANNKFFAKKNKAHLLKLQLKEAQEKLAEQDKKKTRIAVNKLRKIKDDDEEQLKQRELQIQLRQEKEKRLDAEQEVFDMKDEMEHLRKELSDMKIQYAELKGTDIEPLVELLKDLQVEAITINSEYESLIQSIPEEPEIADLGIPEEFCESPLATKVLAQATQYHVENKELRILLRKFGRYASIYKRISNVLAKYPIITTEDIGTQVERGCWVLTADVEHLQRCIVKLHELLIRKYNC
ncbi:hypothetical protein M9Y10_041002 [Tritrichomonas musculus]|uniref:Uncharacterized protein n=1 Tax=Tritrichomonas musculus TaxID=1915356 RepID=A0ABR2K3R6_9EUKA